MANRSKTWWGQEFLSALENFMDSGPGCHVGAAIRHRGGW